MAAPATPPNPNSKAGHKALRTKTVNDVMVKYPLADRHAMTIQAGWALEGASFGKKKNNEGPVVTVADTGNYLDKAHVHATRGHRAPKKHIQSVLNAMHQQPDIRQGIHYHGEIKLTAQGKPCLNSHNQMIALTANGVFTLVNFLIPDLARVQFLNHMFDVMLTLYQTFIQMQADFKTYSSNRTQQVEERRDGMKSFLQETSLAMGVTEFEANMSTVTVAHQNGYRAFFRGLRATDALRKAKLLKKNEQTGAKMHRAFSLHGLLADEFRLSTMAQAVRLKQADIECLPNKAARKKRVLETIGECTDHFMKNGTFDIPGASQTQQTKAFVETQRIKRKRIT